MSPHGDVALAKSLSYSIYIRGSISFFACIQFPSGCTPRLPTELFPSQYLC